jgi:hypothetical protein
MFPKDRNISAAALSNQRNHVLSGDVVVGVDLIQRVAKHREVPVVAVAA